MVDRKMPAIGSEEKKDFIFVENSYLMTTDYYRKCLGKPRFVEG
jgi:hypothetical protein